MYTCICEPIYKKKRIEADDIDWDDCPLDDKDWHFMNREILFQHTEMVFK